MITSPDELKQVIQRIENDIKSHEEILKKHTNEITDCNKKYNKSNKRIHELEDLIGEATDFELMQKLEQEEDIEIANIRQYKELIRAHEEKINVEKTTISELKRDLQKYNFQLDKFNNPQDDNENLTPSETTNTPSEETTQNNEQQTPSTEEQQELADKAKKSKEKIEANIKLMLNPEENIHKTVCLKAGILPSTPYALKFCQWLSDNTEYDENGNCDWYIITESGSSKIDNKILKKYKKSWLIERAANKAAEKEANADAKEEATNNAVENASSAKEKYDALSKKVDTLKSNIKKLTNEKEDIEKTLTKIKTDDVKNTAQRDSLNNKLTQLSNKIASYNNELKTITDNKELENLKKQIDIEAEEAKKQKEEDKKQAKVDKLTSEDIKWWSQKLRKYKGDEIKAAVKAGTAENHDVIPDEATVNELDKMAAFIVNFGPTEYNISVDDLAPKHISKNKDLLNSILKKVWANKISILGVKNELSQGVLDNLEHMTPDASIAAFNGAASNTFALAQMGVDIVRDPSIIAERTMFLAELPLHAIEKLTNTVMETVNNYVQQILDVTPITNIPIEATKAIVDATMKPTEILDKIAKDMDPASLANAMKDIQTGAIQEATAQMTAAVNRINEAVGEKLEGFTKATDKIVKTLNQGPDWYIDNVNALEYKVEKEIISNIESVVLPVLSYKFQFIDFLTSQITYNLVAPINRNLEIAQLFILRQIEELKKQAIAKAKALAAKAIMKILGLLGA